MLICYYVKSKFLYVALTGPRTDHDPLHLNFCQIWSVEHHLNFSAMLQLIGKHSLYTNIHH